ncbi:DUF3426 domain-containing protein [Cupriavidus sp. SZY C1]|uniref:DUF3426 domain-containing protein n=1 Tax=Cupriavidus sp. SZY C1 TaxID=3055037 RepID=UPI0028B83D6E|nr:DUF3426 domain-containing protein [Cupriavidus sp. SZY C1]MDT6960595.1 DUF3426 domain-containing protein [Cupriavidus sp. SZY C1]
MAAAKLVTRCPACRTAFRLVADQLRLRQGLVRCGQCDTVFDAREHLIEVPTPGGSGAAGAASSVPAGTPAAAPPSSSVSMAAALAHAEQAQAAARAREADAPFDPGFDPGYEVPALDSPTTMMSEAEAEEVVGVAPEVPREVAPERSPEPEPAETGAVADAVPEEAAAHFDEAAETDAVLPDEAAPQTAPEADPSPEPAETPLTEPPVPWPTLDHAAFDDAPPRPAPTAAAPAPHSSLDPAAAFASTRPSGLPPYGAYSAKASWPPLRPSEGPTSHPADHGTPEPEVPAPVEAAEPGVVAPDPVAELPPEPAAPADPVPSASGFLRSADPADPEAEAWAAQARDVIEHDLGVTPRDDTPSSVARETTTRRWLRRDEPAASAGPVFAPDFLRHTREREQARAPRPKVTVPGSQRTWIRAAAVVLGLGILVQGVFLARSQIAGSVPVLRPVLEAACAPFGCAVPPWRDLEALRIDSSQLQKQDEGADVYQLAVTLRNQGRATTALPAIELVMTDLQDQLLLRRVLQPGEYLEPAQRGFATSGLRAGSELPVRVRFRTQQAAANYRVLIFYP